MKSINTIFIPGIVYCGAKAAILLWTIDPLLSVISAGAYLFPLVDCLEKAFGKVDAS